MNQEIFWSVIGHYNQATILIQIVLFVVFISSLLMKKEDKFIIPPQIVLGICNIFVGIVFDLIYGEALIQKCFAAPLFIAIGILLILEGVKNRSQTIERICNNTKILFIITFLYPFVSILLGHQFPEMVLYIMPCPIICFSILTCSLYKKTNKVLMVLLIIWGLTGVKSLIFNVMEDLILLICGIYGIVYACKMRSIACSDH